MITEGEIYSLSALKIIDEKNILNSTILVISSAIKKNNPELIKAKKKNYQSIKEEKCLDILCH